MPDSMASLAQAARARERERSLGRLSTPNTDHSRSSSMRRRAESDDSDKAGRVWARTVGDPWAPCILTLDGGGIRGYSSLLILKALMHEIWLCEQRLDDEEDSGQERGAPGLLGGGNMAKSPVDATDLSKDAQPALPEAVESSRDRSPLSRELIMGSEDDPRLGNLAEEVEGRYGVSSTDPDMTDAIHAAHRTIGSDTLTAPVSKKKVVSEEELLPCHYFDFVYGTSTGGLIATLLGRLRMTVTEGLELYRKVGDDLFGKRRSSVPLMTKYHHEPLERAVQDIVGSRCHEHPNCDGKSDLHPWDVDHFDEILQRQIPFDVDQPRVCQSCCLTATHDEQISEAYLLRSYPHYYSENAPNWITRYNEGADELPIWKVTRATSAAPFYFEMIQHEVNGVEKSFKDGGIRENNPSGAALSEFHSLYADKAHDPALLLSVGTGLPDQTQDGFATNWSGPLGRIPGISKFLEKRAVFQNVLIKYTEGERQHHQMREHARGEHTWYKRLNVSDGLQTTPLDAWDKGEWRGRRNTPGGATLTHMEDVTQHYLSRDYDPAVDSYAPPGVMVRQAAEKLVRQRRAREQAGGLRWDTFVGKHLHRRPESGNGKAG